ncbi:hypothetical protein [Daejeonia sp. YH14]|uniref:hypothetical protein n=1 Tax=Daejeonia sp. YH14 TaxID=3439042 RepID=UPI003F497918
MAKYKSLMELSGSIGDLVFYTLNGVPVVRRKSGFTKEGYNDPKYIKVRENSSEFGHCSKSGKLLRQTLEPFMGDCGDRYMYQKFARIMTQIKDLDTTSARGKRRIETGIRKPEAMPLLCGFTFGNFENISRTVSTEEGFFTKSVQIIEKTEADEIQLITIKPDFDALQAETREQHFPVNSRKKSFEFDRHFDDTSLLLYFLILKKEKEVVAAGFIS